MGRTFGIEPVVTKPDSACPPSSDSSSGLVDPFAAEAWPCPVAVAYLVDPSFAAAAYQVGTGPYAAVARERTAS